MPPYEKAKRKRLNAPEWKKKHWLKSYSNQELKDLSGDMSLLWVWIEWTADLADLRKYAC